MTHLSITNLDLCAVNGGFLINGEFISNYEWKLLEFNEKDILSHKAEDGKIVFSLSESAEKKLKEYRGGRN